MKLQVTIPLMRMRMLLEQMDGKLLTSFWKLEVILLSLTQTASHLETSTLPLSD